MRHLKHLRMLGLCLAAVFAVAALSASSAFAAGPEWGKCESVGAGSGKYSANCTTKEKGGGYEWKKGKSLAPIHFTGHNVGSGGVLSTFYNVCEGPQEGKRVPRAKCLENGGSIAVDLEQTLNVECEAESSLGVTEGKNKVSGVHVTFTGCILLGSVPCQSVGAAEGEIKTSELKGELGYINKAAHEVGVKLEPVTKHGPFAHFLCPGFGDDASVGVGNSKEGTWYTEGGKEKKGGNDQIISPITPVNEMTSTYTQVYTVNYSTDENVPSKFENKPLSLLESYLEAEESGFSSLWTAAGEEITNVNTPTEPGEIKG